MLLEGGIAAASWRQGWMSAAGHKVAPQEGRKLGEELIG